MCSAGMGAVPVHEGWGSVRGGVIISYDAICACEMTQLSVSPSARAIASISPSVAGGVSRLRMMPRRLADMPARAAIALRPIPERVAASSSTSATA